MTAARVVGASLASRAGGARALEARISERIHEFDMPALLEVLAAAGYTEERIEFRSHRTLVSHGHLVHAIHFEPPPRARVVVTVNLGLLSVQSPLPSFFFQAMDGAGNDLLEHFLGFFDDMLLRERFAGLMPEKDASLLPGGMASLERLQLLRLGSPAGLHWLFRQAFPEAEVKLCRTTRHESVPSRGIQLGAAALGDGTAVGGFATLPVTGLEVSLHVDEPTCGTGAPWAREARRRLDTQVLPLLKHAALPLNVLLVLRDQESYAALQQDSFLAYDPMEGAPARDRTVVLFAGNTALPTSPNG